MVRLTVGETAELLGKENHWVYNTLKKLGHDRVNGVLVLDQIYDLFRFSFKAKSFESYIYNKIVSKKYLKIVNSVDKIVELRDRIRNIDKDIFCELVIAYKAIYNDKNIFTIIYYLSRQLGIEIDNRKYVKQFIYKKFCNLVVDDVFNIDVFINKKDLTEVDKEVCEALRDRIRIDFSKKKVLSKK